MQSCDCCCRYNHRQIPRHVDCDGKRMLTSPPPLRCQSDSNNNSSHHDNFNRSNINDKITHECTPENKFEDKPKPFSIDAILSRPVKTEVSRDSKQDLLISHKIRTQRESVSPPCLYRSCHSPSNTVRSCYSPNRLSPEPLSPPHPDRLPIYHHSRFLTPMRNFHFEKHSYIEPTMVHMEKQHFTTGCAGCPDCKISEIRRFRLGPTSVMSNGNDMLAHQESMLSSGQDTKRNKRKRTIFTAEQLDRLEHEFQHQQYVVGQERKYLAVELGLNEIQVKVWFQNRRIKWRKQKGSRMQQVPVQIEDF